MLTYLFLIERLDRYVDAPFLSEEDLLAADAEALSASMTADADINTDTNQSKCLNAKKHQFHKMSEALCDMLSDFSLVSFLPLSINDAETVGRVLAQIDKANGYSFAAAEMRARREAASAPTNHFGGASGGPPPPLAESQASLLFRMASQDTELSFFRSIEIMEKYSSQLPMKSRTDSA